ncbi:MAG: hypothetical protein JRI23_31185 [Deltaproteobacteria bacterium]|nr:hypothetical protein [Deltaproteobacteria bacterium]MBW2536667.1 hypothetical protein [Deltaproteobacteria bacterium]
MFRFNSPSISRRAALLLGGLALPACSVADASPRVADEAAALESPEDQAGDRGPRRGPPPGPPPCDTSEDCTDRCPPGSAGCACHQVPHGGKLCIPTCAEDADCPELPEGGPELRCVEGICTPPHPPPGPGPKPCQAEQDCEEACPPGSAGCTCHQTPGPKLCVPTCAEDEDCPAPPGGGGPPMRCVDGVCAPPPPPMR